jgi:hypothetical protein
MAQASVLTAVSRFPVLLRREVLFAIGSAR